MSNFNPNFTRRETPPRLHPRKVRGGIRLPTPEEGVSPWDGSWAAQRWVRFIEEHADGQNLKEGLEYARLGQTKTLAVDPGLITAVVQGRADRAYACKISVPTYTDEQWLVVLKAISEGSAYSAKIFANELPASIEEVFIPAGLKLFPTEPSELSAQCTCRRSWQTTPAPGTPAAPAQPQTFRWCKHALCAAYLVADRLINDPFLMFRLRGLPASELVDRLRHLRTAGTGGAGLYVGRVPGVSDGERPDLLQSVPRFWEAGPELAELDTRILPPPLIHPLLRRLGASPFTNSTFPLVGLLASCYDTISQDVVRRSGSIATPDEPAPADTEADDDDDAQ